MGPKGYPYSHECPFTPFLPALCCLCTHSFCSSRGASWSPWGNRRKKWEQQASETVSKHGLFGNCFYF